METYQGMTDNQVAVDFAAGQGWTGFRNSGARPGLTAVLPAPQVAPGRARRTLNVVVAGVLLLLSAPVLVAISILIKLTSTGPVLYRQTRIGRDRRHTATTRGDARRRNDLGGRPFAMLKFRTMRVDAEQGTGAVWAARNDPRVTSIGRVLRLHRLDELPQLLNVLVGDMNLVGPRPERPAIVAWLRREIPGYQQRHRALPGITGHAQVTLHYDASLADVHLKVRCDLAYIQRASAWEDVTIMIKTVPVMLFRQGAR